LVYLGKISYGLYVFHGLMLGVAAKIWPHCFALQVLTGLVATGAAAAISYRFLERPFLLLKRRFEHLNSRPA
jgi:peptidoglycan/LPS O-acetylase OafA/YrhL